MLGSDDLDVGSDGGGDTVRHLVWSFLSIELRKASVKNGSED